MSAPTAGSPSAQSQLPDTFPVYVHPDGALPGQPPAPASAAREAYYRELALMNERRVETAHRRTGYSRLSSADEFRTAFSAFRSTMNADVSALADAADLACADIMVENPANVIESAIREEISEYRSVSYH